MKICVSKQAPYRVQRLIGGQNILFNDRSKNIYKIITRIRWNIEIDRGMVGR